VAGVAAVLGALAVAAPAQAAAPRVWTDGFDAAPRAWKAAGPKAVLVHSTLGGRALLLGRGASLTRTLPAPSWALSLDVLPARGGTVAIELGDPGHVLRLVRGANGTVTVRSHAGSRRLVAGPNPPAGGWLHVEGSASASSLAVAVNGQRFALDGRAGRRLRIRAEHGAAAFDNAMATDRARRSTLLLHRLAALQVRLAPRSFLLGAGPTDRLYLRQNYWTRGFLAGALWQASSLAPGRDPFDAFALARTKANFGQERADTHDLGFMYEHSSEDAYRRLCRTAATRATAQCRQLRASALSAADGLMAVAATNPGGGTIPVRKGKPGEADSDTIIDSLMNLPILYWASAETGDARYRDLAARHARRVAGLLVRPDGSTAQAVFLNRQTGAVGKIHTHQGISDSSTWSRGQAWAVYGLTTSATALRDPALLRAAERTAGYVASHLPASGVPRYDYDAPEGAPLDTSAGVITAAGLFRLHRLCVRWAGACERPAEWAPLARRMLRASLAHVSQDPPLGYFGDQAYTVGGGPAWDDRAELAWGLFYAIEAVNLDAATR
jgi:unsaturated chondroitin disaccharide hydrolase